jgi:hypothetical protein
MSQGRSAGRGNIRSPTHSSNVYTCPGKAVELPLLDEACWLPLTDPHEMIGGRIWASYTVHVDLYIRLGYNQVNVGHGVGLSEQRHRGVGLGECAGVG